MHRPPKHTRGSSNEDSDPSKLSITNEMLVLTVLYTALSLIVSPTVVVIDASSYACIYPTIFKLSHKSNTTTRYLYHPLSIFFSNFTLKNSGNFFFASSTNFFKPSNCYLPSINKLLQAICNCSSHTAYK